MLNTVSLSHQMEKESKEADGIEFVGEDGRADLLEDDMDEDGYTVLPTVEVDFDDDISEPTPRSAGKGFEAETAGQSDTNIQGDESSNQDKRQEFGADSGAGESGSLESGGEEGQAGDDLNPRDVSSIREGVERDSGGNTRAESDTVVKEVLSDRTSLSGVQAEKSDEDNPRTKKRKSGAGAQDGADKARRDTGGQKNPKEGKTKGTDKPKEKRSEEKKQKSGSSWLW